MLLPGYGGPPGAKGVAGAGCGACLALSLLSLLSLLCLRPSVSLVARCSLCFRRKGKHHQANSSPSASRRLSPPPRPRRPRPLRFPSCLHLLKIQCCAAVVGAMAVFLYAMQASLPKSSYPYVTTCLEGFLLTGMSSHLSKVLIVYAEVVTAAGAAEVGAATAAAAVAAATSRGGGGEGSGDGEHRGEGGTGGARGAASPVVAQRMGAKSSLANLPRLSHLRPTILGIVTGLPVLAVLATHLSHHASGWDLPSWWLALGSSLFNVFLASASLISLLFAFLCASLLRRLRNLLILITAPTRNPNGLTLTGGGEDSGVIASRLENVKARGDVRIIRRRVAFLRRAAAIFSSMVVMETASVFYINIPDDVVTHYFFSISSALLGVVIFVCYVVKSEAPLGLCRLFRGGRRKRARGKRGGGRLRCGVRGPEDNEDDDDDEEDDEDDEDDDGESDSSDSLDSPLTLSLKPDLGNEDSSFHGSLRKKTFKKQSSDPGTGETYIDTNPLTDEELAVALAKKSLSLQTSGISLTHVPDQCVANPAFDSADLVDAVLPYSEWKQREAGGGRKPQRSNSCCGVAGRICAEEDDAEDDQGRMKGICKQTGEDVVVVKAQVEINAPKSSLRSPKDTGAAKDAPEKTVAFSQSAKTPTLVRKSILKNPLPPKSVTILNPEPDVVEKEPPFPLVLDDLPPPIGDSGLLSLNAVLSPEGYDGVTEPLQCPDVLDVPENRIPIGVGVCGSVDPERIVLTNDEVRRNSYPSVRGVPVATTARPTPDNVPPAPSKYALYRSAGGTLGSKDMKIIEEEEEEEGEDVGSASSGACAKSMDAVSGSELADKKHLDERVLQELRRCPEGREEGKDSMDEAFGQTKAEASPSTAVNGDGEGGAEDLDGMLDRITLDLDYLLNRTPKHGTKTIGKEDVDLELPEEMIALSTFEAPEPPPPDAEIN